MQKMGWFGAVTGHSKSSAENAENGVVWGSYGALKVIGNVTIR